MITIYITNAIKPASGISLKKPPSAVRAMRSTLANLMMALTTPIKAPPAMKPEAIRVPRL